MYRYRGCNCQSHANIAMETMPNTSNCPQYVQRQNDNQCDCGFDETQVFPSNPMYGQSYVPIQYMNKTFMPNVGLKMGTIFPELVIPYSPGQSMREIEYIAMTNKIKEGCNG